MKQTANAAATDAAAETRTSGTDAAADAASGVNWCCC